MANLIDYNLIPWISENLYMLLHSVKLIIIHGQRGMKRGAAEKMRGPRRAWSKKICTRRSPWYPGDLRVQFFFRPSAARQACAFSPRRHASSPADRNYSFRSRGIKMLSIKVAIQLYWFPWSPRYEKLVYICLEPNLPVAMHFHALWRIRSKVQAQYSLKAGPPWFEFLVIFNFFAPWYRRGREASSVKIL